MIVSIILIILCTSANADDAKVKLPKYGFINGAKKKSREGIEYFAFRGVQYGKAPKGDLRFRDPEEPDRWDTRDAIKFANKCPQMHPADPQRVSGDEDCLYLNVYTRTLNQNAKLPVVVYIHGGGFNIGASSTFGPQYFMDKPLILVTFNYRLNAFGFMHLDDKLLPGNYGMKDQVAVLKWVQEHIQLFGGNPGAVTLMGQSAGAGCVNWHMYSPLSKNLFHRAILQSGTARRIRAGVPRHVAQKRAETIATIAGCVFESVEENVECLRELSMEELLRFQSRLEIWKGNPYYFGVVVESEDSEKPFITVNPWDRKPHTENMPIIIGYTLDEGGLTVPGLLRNQGEAIEELGEKYKRLFPVLMAYRFNLGLEREKDMSEVTKKIREHYFDDAEINKTTFPRIKKMLADSQVIYDTYVTLKTYEVPRYFYVYSHKNERTFAEFEKPNFLDVIYFATRWLTRTSSNVDELATTLRTIFSPINDFTTWWRMHRWDLFFKGGPVHSDDLISLFNLESIFRGAEDLNDADLQVSKLMINLWSSFIINGDPNIDNDKGPKWKPITDEIHFYSIDVEPTVQEFSWENYSFWEDLKWHMET